MTLEVTSVIFWLPTIIAAFRKHTTIQFVIMFNINVIWSPWLYSIVLWYAIFCGNEEPEKEEDSSITLTKSEL